MKPQRIPSASGAILANVAPPRSRSPLLAGAVAGVIMVAGAFGMALGVPTGSAAPPIQLADLNGRVVDTDSLKPQSRVIVFGDFSHQGVAKACADVVETIGDSRHTQDPVVGILVIMHDDTPSTLKEEIAARRVPPLVLIDPDRKAFGAYRVLVMPTVVIIDPSGKVVHSMSGPVQHFKEKLSAALLRCAGRMPEEQFQRIISPEAQGATPEGTRADRLIRLGNELARHGLFELAEARFTEAAAIAPGNTEARLGVAAIMLRTGRLDAAETAYREVAAADEGSVDSAIGIATVQASRGGEDLKKAEAAASELIARHPSQPKVRFLMGLIHERKGDCAAALAEFKRAAELSIINAPAEPPPAGSVGDNTSN